MGGMGNILVFHMSAPLIGGYTPPSRACLVPPTFCRLNVSAHQDIKSNLLRVHDDFQPSRFTASDPQHMEVSTHLRLKPMLFGGLQSAEMHGCESELGLHKWQHPLMVVCD